MSEQASPSTLLFSMPLQIHNQFWTATRPFPCKTLLIRWPADILINLPGPCLVFIVNCNRDLFKHEFFLPLLKKRNLNPSLNYRPLSKLPLISKILEKVVAKQLPEVLAAHNIFDIFQYGFRERHSTETALFRVSSALGESCVLVVDHCILIERLKELLDWFAILSYRSFSCCLVSSCLKRLLLHVVCHRGLSWVPFCSLCFLPLFLVVLMISNCMSPLDRMKLRNCLEQLSRG